MVFFDIYAPESNKWKKHQKNNNLYPTPILSLTLTLTLTSFYKPPRHPPGMLTIL